MNIFEKIKITTNRVLNNVFKVSNIETLNYQKEKMENILNKAIENLNNIKGKNKQKESLLARNKTNLKALVLISRDWNDVLKEKTSLKEEKDEATQELKKCYEFYEQTEKDNQLLKKQIEVNEKIIADIENKIELYRSKIIAIEKNIDVLEAKAEYAENIKNFKKISKTLKCDGDLKDISQKIDADYYAAEFDLQDLEKEEKESQDIQDFIEKNTESSCFSDFLKMIESEPEDK